MAFCTNCGSSMEGQFCTKCGSRTGEPAPQVVQAAAPPPVAPVAPVAPKKSKALLFVLVGCGGLIVIVLIVMALVGYFVSRKASEFGKNPGFAAAKMMASMNPNVEVLNADEGTGKITLRDRKSGKTTTLNFQDIQKGRISFTGENGEKVDIGQGSLENVPSWVPKYPGGQVAGTFSAQGEGESGGTFQIKCSGSVEEVAAYYEKELTGAGMKVDKNTMQSGGTTLVSLTGTDEANQHTVHATVTSSGEGTVAHIIYGAK